VGGKRKGKRGGGAKGKTPVLVAVESKGKSAGFIAMQAVNSVCHDNVEKVVAKHLTIQQKVRTDGLPALNMIDKTQQHEARVTPVSLLMNGSLGFILPLVT
jgi:hypothetical protein